MLDNYARFGDLLALDIVYELVNNISHDSRRYRVAVFTVRDTNVRPLFAGLALLVDS